MDKFCFRVCRLDLSSQFFYMAVYRTVADNTFIGIDLVHKLLPPVNTPGIGDQELQQFELHCREFQVMTVQQSLIALLVYGQSGRLDRFSIIKPRRRTALTRAITSRGLYGLQM